MQPRCTCGALLPEDARFCHKCAKPQWEEDIARLNAHESSPAPVQAPLEPPLSNVPGIGFRNSRAVLISLLVAACTLVSLMAVALLVPSLAPLVLCGGGFLSAKLYKGESTQALTTAAGARLGWMTGLWLFVVVAIGYGMSALLAANPTAWDQLKASSAQFPQSSKLLSLGPHEFAMQLLYMLPISFVFLTILPGLGGMLGAKLGTRRRAS